MMVSTLVERPDRHALRAVGEVDREKVAELARTACKHVVVSRQKLELPFHKPRAVLFAMLLPVGHS